MVTATLLVLAWTTMSGAASPDPIAGKGQLRGSVSGPDEEPLIGVSIVLVPTQNNHVLYATSTDEGGKYGFNGLLTDVYQVYAEGQGFASVVKKRISVKPPFRAIIDFEMQPIGPGEATVMPGSDADPGAVEPGTVGQVEGVFVDGKGEPVLEGSVVFRRLDDADDVFYAQTDEQGHFSQSNLPAGVYDITTKSPGLIPLHLFANALTPTDVFHLRLVAPTYPLSFRGWIADLLPTEIPVPPPLPHEIDYDALMKAVKNLPPEDPPGTDDGTDGDPADDPNGESEEAEGEGDPDAPSEPGDAGGGEGEEGEGEADPPEAPAEPSGGGDGGVEPGEGEGEEGDESEGDDPDDEEPA